MYDGRHNNIHNFYVEVFSCYLHCLLPLPHCLDLRPTTYMWLFMLDNVMFIVMF